MNNIFRKISYCILIITIICSFSVTLFATSTQELQSQESEIQTKIDETSSEISGVQSKMTKALTEVNTITTQISEYENKISELSNQITDLTSQITTKQSDLEEQELKYNEKVEIFNNRLVAMYKAGNTSYLDVLLSSSSLTDFISRYYFVEQMVECDKELITSIQDLKTKMEAEKKELEKNKSTLEISKKSEEIQQTALGNLKREKEVLVSNLSDEEKELQTQLDQYEEDKKLVEMEIAKAIEEENRRKAEEEAKRKAEEEARRKAEEEARKKAGESNSSNSSSSTSSKENSTPSTSKEPSEPSESGFICPLAGRNKNDITTGLYGYSGHTGVDFARNSKGAVDGLPVLAAKSGTVIISKALKNSNGDYRSYGEYIVISHSDGLLSAYAHMRAGSRLVSVGDKVVQGQQIGTVGSTGNSTGPHLHFEIRLTLENGRTKTLNPVNYLP